MTIYDKTQDEKIQFPVGIGIIQTEPVRNFYNTSDATATSSDIVVGKTAYSRYGMINGELDLQNEKETSYQEGYEFGYDEGNDAGYILGKEDGKEEIIEGQSDATITPENVLKGYIGYGVNNERIVGTSDAITSIDVSSLGIKFGYSNFTEIPSVLDFSNVTNMGNMFYYCTELTTVPLFDTSNVDSMNSMFNNCSSLTTIPLYNTSNVTTMNSMFRSCSSLTNVPLFNTSNVRDMSYMFYYCNSLTTVPLFDTSNVTNMYNMFFGCNALTTVPQFNTSKCQNFQNMFANCSSLTTVPEFDFSGFKGTEYKGSEIFGTSYNYPTNLTTIGGFKDIGKAYSGGASSNKDILLQYLSKLTRESVLNVFNKVYDMNLNTAQTGAVNIKLHANVKALLSDEDIAIATNKGWTVQ